MQTSSTIYEAMKREMRKKNFQSEAKHETQTRWGINLSMKTCENNILDISKQTWKDDDFEGRIRIWLESHDFNNINNNNNN